MPQINRPAVVALAKATYLFKPGAPRARVSKTQIAPQIDEATAAWFALAGRIGEHIDFDSCAAAVGYVARHRGIPTSAALLALALQYGPGGLSLRQLADSVRRLALANVSEPALLRCLHGTAAWLEAVAEKLIIEQLLQRDTQESGEHDGLTLRPYADWQFAAQAAKHFLLDFMPWQDGVFTVEQEQWLLCARWNFVAATINSAHATPSAGFGVAPTMERVRMLAHLIAAVTPETTA